MGHIVDEVALHFGEFLLAERENHRVEEHQQKDQGESERRDYETHA